jgi:AraC-like DNA-binding protein
MQLKHYRVNDPSLADYIDYYYLLTTSDDAKVANYTAYPSINTPLCFLDQCTVTISDGSTTVVKNTAHGLKSVIVGRSVKPVHISIESGIREFSIVFKPLGINFLLKQNLGNSIGNGLKEVNLFDFLKETVAKILNDDTALVELEEKMVAHLHQSKELDDLQKIITLIQSNEVISFNEISYHLEIPYKTIYRLFIKHIGLTPIQFRRIIKFRMALKKGIDSTCKNKMSTIAVESGYFDQAHYINEFKKMAKLTPKNFIASVWVDDSKKIAWKFE